MPTLALPDITLHYEIDGSGPPLLLLAGMMSDSASWGPLTEPLTKTYTVIRPDNRTTGRTLPADAPASLAIWAADALALMNHLGLPSAHVAGHSLGGMIALHMAQTAPDKVRSLTLLASGPLHVPRNDHLFETFLALRQPGLPPDLWLRALFPWLFHPRVYVSESVVETMLALSLGYPHAQSAEAMRQQVTAMQQITTDMLIPPSAPPTLAILAANDLLFPLDLARTAVNTIPGAALAVIPGAGHSVHWDAPEAVLAAMQAHLARHTGAD